jgi:hypothetical protein
MRTFHMHLISQSAVYIMSRWAIILDQLLIHQKCELMLEQN